jgi:hypothetical protein
MAIDLLRDKGTPLSEQSTTVSDTYSWAPGTELTRAA